MEMKSAAAGALLLVASSSYAAPVLLFDGSFHYDSNTQLLTVDAYLTGSQDVSQPVDLPGHFSLTTQWLATQAMPGTIDAQFGTAATAGDDFLIQNDDNSTLLGGDVDALTMSGFTGSNLGVMRGNLSAESGSLLSDFYTDTSLFALQLNLTSLFAADMFDADFSGRVGGRLEGIPGAAAIPEPGTLPLLGLGVVALMFTRRNQKWGN